MREKGCRSKEEKGRGGKEREEIQPNMIAA